MVQRTPLLMLAAMVMTAGCHLVAGLDELEVAAGAASSTGGQGGGGGGGGGGGAPACTGSGASSLVPTEVFAAGDAAHQSQPYVATAPGHGAIIVGSFGGTLSFGTGGAGGWTATDADDLLVARAGTTLEMTFGHGIDIDQQRPVAAIDASGNSYVFGTFTGNTTLGGGSSAIGHDLFVVAYDASGSKLWDGTWGGAADQHGLAIAAAPGGGVYLAGAFQGTLAFGGGCTPGIVSLQDLDAFVAHLKADGSCEWAKSFGGDGDQYAQALAVDQGGHIWVTGSFAGSFTITGMNPLTTMAPAVPYLLQLDGTGKAQRAWSFGSNGNNTTSGLGRALAVDAAGNVLLVGDFAGALDLGDGVVIAGHPAPYTVGGGDIFVAKYDPGGSLSWKHVYGDAESQVARSVAIGPSNRVVVVGDFQGCLDLGGASFASRGGQGNDNPASGPIEAGGGDVFALELDENGGYLSSGAYGGSGSELGRSIAPYGTSYLLVGELEESADFAGVELMSAGGKDLFLATFAMVPPGG